MRVGIVIKKALIPADIDIRQKLFNKSESHPHIVAPADATDICTCSKLSKVEVM